MKRINMTGRFNGATLFSLEIPAGLRVSGGSRRLQWGHVFSDVEIEITVGGVSHGAAPQWGHVFSDVEIIARTPAA